MAKTLTLTGVSAILVCGFLLACTRNSVDSEVSQNISLRSLTLEIRIAQKAEDVEEIHRLVRQAIKALGDRAGTPEEPDDFAVLPPDARLLDAEELSRAFDAYLPLIERRKWWCIGLDPTQTNHALREVASVIEGCVAASRVNPDQTGVLLEMAREAGDFLVWTQEQGGTGVFPFPAMRNGRGRPFEVAEVFYRRAEKDGVLHEVTRNGWAIEDLDDGGLQFDNGLSGVALLRLFKATANERYRIAAIDSARWAMTRPVVPNWNYNSFSVYLLAEAYRISGEEEFLAAARKKAVLGVLPGQITVGPKKGRWADPHNARPAYHYIMIRGLAALCRAMPEGDPDLPWIVERLRLALLARNPDYRKGVFNLDSSVEALILVKSLPAHIALELEGCDTDVALDTLERFTAECFRTGKPALSPGAWGQLLEYRKAQVDGE